MKPLLKIQDLEVAFIGDEKVNKVIDGVSFSVNPGEIVCVVGESGSGKSVTVLSVMGLLSRKGQVTAGVVEFDGQDLLSKSEKELDKIRGSSLTMIFQDAMTSLNPVFNIGTQMIETMRIHMGLDKKAAKERAIYLLAKVGLPDPVAIMKKFPHTLSGGMRQRVMIAMALACNPKLLIADEPTTALDVTIQAQIMELIKSLKEEFGMAILLITHDLGLVAEMADRVLVMYAGQVVEEADVDTLFHNPGHPYTKSLLKSIPSITDDEDHQLLAIHGSVPENYQEITGCRFANRCPYAQEECLKPQILRPVGDNQRKRCWKDHYEAK